MTISDSLQAALFNFPAALFLLAFWLGIFLSFPIALIGSIKRRVIPQIVAAILVAPLSLYLVGAPALESKGSFPVVAYLLAAVAARWINRWLGVALIVANVGFFWWLFSGLYGRES